MIVIMVLLLDKAAASKAEGHTEVIRPANSTEPAAIDPQQSSGPLLYATIALAVVLFAVICVAAALYVRRRLRLLRTYSVSRHTVVELADRDIFLIHSLHRRLDQVNSSLDVIRAGLALGCEAMPFVSSGQPADVSLPKGRDLQAPDCEIKEITETEV